MQAAATRSPHLRNRVAQRCVACNIGLFQLCAGGDGCVRRRRSARHSRVACTSRRAPHLVRAAAASRRAELQNVACVARPRGGRPAVARARAAQASQCQSLCPTLLDSKPSEAAAAPTAAALPLRAAVEPPRRRARQQGGHAGGPRCAAIAMSVHQGGPGAFDAASTRVRRGANAQRMPVLNADDAGEGGDVRWPQHCCARAGDTAGRAERPPPRARCRLHVPQCVMRGLGRSAARRRARALAAAAGGLVSRARTAVRRFVRPQPQRRAASRVRTGGACLCACRSRLAGGAATRLRGFVLYR